MCLFKKLHIPSIKIAINHCPTQWLNFLCHFKYPFPLTLNQLMIVLWNCSAYLNRIAFSFFFLFDCFGFLDYTSNVQALILTRHSRITPGSALETIWDTSYLDWVSSMQGKGPIHCAIALASHITLFKLVVFSSKHRILTELLIYSSLPLQYFVPEFINSSIPLTLDSPLLLYLINNSNLYRLKTYNILETFIFCPFKLFCIYLEVI